MFTRIATLLKSKESFNIAITKSEDEASLTVSIVSKVSGRELKPYSAAGTPAELEEKLFDAFEASLTKARGFFTNDTEMLESAKPSTKPASTTTTKPKGGAKTKPTTKVENTESEKTDDNDDEEKVDDAPFEKTEPAPAPVKELKLNKAQKTALDIANSQLEKASKQGDPDMVDFLKKKTMQSLKDAGLDVYPMAAEMEASFDEVKKKLEASNPSLFTVSPNASITKAEPAPVVEEEVIPVVPTPAAPVAQPAPAANPVARAIPPRPTAPAAGKAVEIPDSSLF